MVIKSRCAKHQDSSYYLRSKIAPSRPLIDTVTATGYNSAQIILKNPETLNLDAPIAFYTITPSVGKPVRITNWRDLAISITTLNALTTYSFTVSATSADGESVISAVTQSITTPMYTPPTTVTTNQAPVLIAPAFTLSALAETRTVSTTATGFTVVSTGGAIASFAISSIPGGMSFSTTSGALTGTPSSLSNATDYVVTATNARGSTTRTFTLTVTTATYVVGQRGLGGGIIFYVAAVTFASPGSTCNNNGIAGVSTCKYLETAPAGWNNGGIVAADPHLIWSTSNALTGQDTRTVTIQGYNAAEEKANWRIGTGFFNTSVMQLTGETSTARSAVLAYGGTDSSQGQWFIPAMNELNELCKYARGQLTGNLTVRCNDSAALKVNSSEEEGFSLESYLGSTEHANSQAWGQHFEDNASAGNQNTLNKDSAPGHRVRPIRAI